MKYDKESLQLPDPPEGWHWTKDEKTKEWRLVAQEKSQPSAELLMALHHDASEMNDGDSSLFKDMTVDTTPRSLDSPDIKGHEAKESFPLENADKNTQPSAATPPKQFKKGLDYAEHIVLPSDTLQGLCIKYKVTAAKIRQANNFTGTNLLLAPSTLLIPLNREFVIDGRIRQQDRNSKEFKRQAFLDKVIGMSSKEADAYLDMADGDLEVAIQEALADREWEKANQQQMDQHSIRSRTYVESDKRKNQNSLHLDVEISDNSVHEAIPVQVPQGIKELEMRRLIPRQIRNNRGSLYC